MLVLIFVVIKKIVVVTVLHLLISTIETEPRSEMNVIIISVVVGALIVFILVFVSIIIGLKW